MWRAAWPGIVVATGVGSKPCGVESAAAAVPALSRDVFDAMSALRCAGLARPVVLDGLAEVDGDAQIAGAVFRGGRQATGIDVDLHALEQQSRRGQRGIAGPAEGDEILPTGVLP